MSKKPNNSLYIPKECNNNMSFNECELAVLRHAVDANEKLQGKKLASGDDIKKMVKIVEDFLSRKKLICYGGTAINNILPKYAQFYDRDIEIPDYDFFSPDALEDAKELADNFYKEGYLDVEAKSGIHEGTYKVFVNFIPMADVTQLHPDLFNSLLKDAISVAGIKYAPPNFLRMGMYLELSRPAGDVSRWEKVLKRLTLLNTYYPMKVDYDCNTVDFQRKMEDHKDQTEMIYFTVRDAFIEMGVVFFGGYASSLYARDMPKEGKRFIKQIPDFDVLAEEPEKVALIVEERLLDAGIKNITRVYHAAIGEIIPEHIEIRYGKEILAFVYKPIACHNYNTIHIGNQEINVATIDTILSFYLAFLYAGASYYYKDRILCMAKFLFELIEKNRLAQKGLLTRFTSTCIGNQETLESIRAKKAAKFAELRKQKGTKEYEEWFLKYNPAENDKKSKKLLEDTDKTKDKINSPSSVRDVLSQKEKDDEKEDEKDEKEKDDKKDDKDEDDIKRGSSVSIKTPLNKKTITDNGNKSKYNYTSVQDQNTKSNKTHKSRTYQGKTKKSKSKSMNKNNKKPHVIGRFFGIPF